MASLADPVTTRLEVFVAGARYKGRRRIGPAPVVNSSFYAAFSPPSALGGARTFTEPPAFSTASVADLEAP